MVSEAHLQGERGWPVATLDDEAQVPFDDDTTYTPISSARTLDVFQIESHAAIKPAGDDTGGIARKLWHRSPGSPG